jgi:hypothetical protein
MGISWYARGFTKEILMSTHPVVGKVLSRCPQRG